MPHIEKSIDIQAPREHVFAYAVKPESQPEWTTFIKEVALTSGDGKSEGTTDRCVVKIGPRAQALDALWTEYKPGESFGRRSTSGMAMQGRLAFEPSGGGTRVVWTVDYTPPMGPVGAIVDVLFMNRVFQNEIEASLENLKSRLEA